MIKQTIKIFSKIFLVMLLCLIVFTMLIPSTQAAEETTASKALTILDDVVGLDTSAYNVNIESYSQDLYFEVLPQEYLEYTLASEESKLSIIYSFVDQKLRSMNIYPTDGLPRTTQTATSTIEMAKDFLDKYQEYSGTSYYGTMQAMLDSVEADTNTTKTSENIKLETTVTANYASFRWTYTVSGVEAPSKCVALKFEQGFLKYFIDTWSLWTVGSTKLNVSEENAIELAMKAAENYSWNVNMGDENQITVTDFNIVGVSETTLQIGNYATKDESRYGDPLILYPNWHVKLYFDELYPGRVYGLDIGIWADTGEVNDIRTLLLLGEDYSPAVDANNEDSTLLQANEENNGLIPSNMPLLAGIALSIVIVCGVTIVYAKRKKQGPHKMRKMLKANSLKHGGTLLCLLCLVVMLPLTTLPATNAGTYVMPLYGSTYEVETSESDAAQSVIYYWGAYFNTWTDYTIYNLYGSDTQKSTILDHAAGFEANFDHVAMFHYGHAGKDFSTGHYDYFDDDGWDDFDDQVWDYEVYGQTGSSKHFFVVLWSCRQGDIVYGGTDGQGVKGMPYAWFHGYPSSGDCFIGFEGASMPITQPSANNTNYDHEIWLKRVGLHLSNNHATVIGALDAATNELFNCNYNRP